MLPRAAGVDPETGESPFAGWTRRTVLLSAGELGMRVITLSIDAAGRVDNASDMVMRGPFAAEAPEGEEGAAPIARSQSIGGRFDPAQGFLGTRWDGGAKRAPSGAEIAALEALVAEVMRRPATPARG
jgi:hypothetical protein